MRASLPRSAGAHWIRSSRCLQLAVHALSLPYQPDYDREGHRRGWDVVSKSRQAVVLAPDAHVTDYGSEPAIGRAAQASE